MYYRRFQQIEFRAETPFPGHRRCSCRFGCRAVTAPGDNLLASNPDLGIDPSGSHRILLNCGSRGVCRRNCRLPRRIGDSSPRPGWRQFRPRRTTPDTTGDVRPLGSDATGRGRSRGSRRWDPGPCGPAVSYFSLSWGSSRVTTPSRGGRPNGQSKRAFAGWFGSER